MSLRLPWLRPEPQWFPPIETALAEPDGLLCAGGDLQPARLLSAYARGIFPWYCEGQPILWWTPDPRCVLPLDEAHPSSRMRRWLRSCDWTLSADRCFAQVIDACAAPRAAETGTWITAAMRAAYCHMHSLGHAHSVEVHDATGELIGGIYGLALGQVFFGESMFSRRSQASKVALFALCQVLRERNFLLLDGQVESAHLLTLGFRCWPRARFKAVLETAVAGPIDAGSSWSDDWPLVSARALR